MHDIVMITCIYIYIYIHTHTHECIHITINNHDNGNKATAALPGVTPPEWACSIIITITIVMILLTLAVIIVILSVLLMLILIRVPTLDPSDHSATAASGGESIRSVFKVSCLFLRPRLWQFEI